MLKFTPTSNEVFAFLHGGVEITNPLVSECGRFVYDPADPTTESVPRSYGFNVLETGGGCTAWHAEGLLNGRKVYMLVTDDDGRHEVAAVDGCHIGLYDDETGDLIVEWLQPYEGDPVVEQIGPTDQYARALASVSADRADHEVALCQILHAWCAKQGLQCRSADEMAADEDLTAEQRAFAAAFCVVWDEVMA